ncbi:hypothetical protein LLH00_00075 [bacterium]|nr:hypothetical protein [bacterium]
MFEPTVSPFNPDFAFLRCDMSGAYVTRDGGASWRMFNLRGVVLDFEFDPADSLTAYACNSGLYRTVDGGASWSLVHPAPERVRAERMVGDHASQWFDTGDSLDSFAEMQRVKVDPLDNRSIWVGWGAYRVYRDSLPALRLNDYTTIQLSEDKGASFRSVVRVPGTAVLGIFPAGRADTPGELTVLTDRACAVLSGRGESMQLLPLPVEQVFAANAGYDSGRRVIYIVTPIKQKGAATEGGVYRSADGGRTWTRLVNGLLDEWQAAGEVPYFNTLAVCESQPANVYLSCRGYSVILPDGKKERQYGVLRSHDSGASWQWVYRTVSRKVEGEKYADAWMYRQYESEWMGNPHGIGVSPADPEIAYSTDYGRAAVTHDGGRSWIQLYARQLPDSSYASRGLDVTTCYGVHFDPFDPQHMFITYTDIGLFNSFNGGAGWVPSLNGVPEPWWNTCYWLTFDPTVKGRVYSVWGNGHDLPRLKMFRRPGFVERFQGGVAVSEDGGRSWKPSSAGMPENSDCAHILLDPDSPAEARVLYVCATGRGVFKSVDGGASWATANTGLGADLNSWEISRLPDGTLYLIVMRALDDHGRTVPGALYASRDKAASWEKMSLPAGVSGPNSLTFDPTDPKRLYLSCWPLPVERVEHGGGLLVSEDGGATWSRIFREDAHVYAAAVDPDDPNVIVINTFDSAAFRSQDRGRSWTRLGGYDFKWGQRPVFDPHHKGMLYLTTFGGSVYYGPATGMSGREEITNFQDRWRWSE